MPPTLPQPGEPLTVLVQAASGKPVFSLAKSLLALCGRKRAELNAELQGTGRARRQKTKRELASFVREHLRSEVLDEEEIEPLSEELRKIVAANSVEFAALALAEALDDALGSRFLDSMPEEFTVAPGDCFFVARPDLKAVFGKKLNSNPESYELPIDATARLRLLDREYDYGLTVSRKATRALARFASDQRVGFGLPNSLENELTIASETEDTFFGVGPRNVERQGGILKRLLDLAEEARVTVLALPELCLEASILDLLKERYRAAKESSTLPVLVAGSQHLLDNGVRRNRCTVLVPGGAVLTHDKIQQFVLKRGQVEQTEDIAPGKMVTVFAALDWSFVPLICKDFLPAAMQSLLLHISPAMVLVPALSRPTEVFVTNAQSLATHIQAVVAVPNTTEDGTQASAILGRPRRDEPVHVHRRDSLQPPVLLIVRTDSNQEHDQCQILA